MGKLELDQFDKKISCTGNVGGVVIESDGNHIRQGCFRTSPGNCGWANNGEGTYYCVALYNPEQGDEVDFNLILCGRT
jgi:hypothetical protein